MAQKFNDANKRNAPKWKTRNIKRARTGKEREFNAVLCADNYDMSNKKKSGTQARCKTEMEKKLIRFKYLFVHMFQCVFATAM